MTQATVSGITRDESEFYGSVIKRFGRITRKDLIRESTAFISTFLVWSGKPTAF